MRKQIDALKTVKPKDKEEKQIEVIDDKSDDMFSVQKRIFDERLTTGRMNKIYNMSEEIDFNNLTYHFKCPDLPSINRVGYRGPLHIYENIRNGNVSIEKAKEYQKQFKSNLSTITTGNP